MSLASCSSCSRSTLSSRPCLPAQRPAARRQQRRGLASSVAALDPATVYAVTQQGIAYVAVLGGEAAFTGLSTDAANPGRPTVTQTLVGAGGTLAAVALVQLGQEGIVGAAGCAVGGLTGAIMLTTMIKRVQTTPYNPNDWPGAKSWPATMGLISFFSLAVFFQALKQALL